VNDGRIVLRAADDARPGNADVLRGDWTDRRGALPAAAGVIELSRAR
jgi:hypothetical protein